jgi:hypothetical protein
MLIRELYITCKDGKKLYKTYSDLNVMIRKIGTEELYEEAIDPQFTSFIYEETDIPIIVINDIKPV